MSHGAMRSKYGYGTLFYTFNVEDTVFDMYLLLPSLPGSTSLNNVTLIGDGTGTALDGIESGASFRNLLIDGYSRGLVGSGFTITDSIILNIANELIVNTGSIDIDAKNNFWGKCTIIRFV